MNMVPLLSTETETTAAGHLPWRKTAEEYKPNSVRNARCPSRSQVNPAPEFHRVRAKNQ